MASQSPEAPLQQLLAMGFNEAEAQEALTTAGGSISAAVELLSNE
jgi:UBA/TS-N domain